MGRYCCGYFWIQKRLEKRKEEESPNELKKILNHPSTVVKTRLLGGARGDVNFQAKRLVKIKMLFLDIHEMHHDEMGH